MKIVTRYDALGIPYPDPETCCRGECEGTGLVPVWFPEGDTRVNEVHVGGPRMSGVEDYERYYAAWQEAETETPSKDGWHFLRCPDCGGTGKRESHE